MPSITTLSRAVVAAIALLGWQQSTSASYPVVHGGPTYVPGAGGYTGAGVGAVHDSGAAVGVSNKIDASERPG